MEAGWSCDEPPLTSISGNECLSVPDTNQYSKALISALPWEPELVIYHRCSYLLLCESVTLASLALLVTLNLVTWPWFGCTSVKVGVFFSLGGKPLKLIKTQEKDGRTLLTFKWGSLKPQLAFSFQVCLIFNF